MTNQELNERLYDRMAEELAHFKDWLLQQPPEVILDRSHEYYRREDILNVLNSYEMTDEQALALLQSPFPLADVYKEYMKMDNGDMNDVWDCLEARAEHVAQERRAMRELPVYREPVAYAQEQGEMKPYNTSLAANVVCKNTVDQIVAANYNGSRLDTAFVFAQLNSMFGPSRLKFILATTIRTKNEDGRISAENKRWAQTVPVPMDERSREYVVDRTHPGLLNLLVNQARKGWAQEKATEKEEERTEEEKPSVRDALQAPSSQRQSCRKTKARTATKAVPHRIDSAR